MKIKNARVGMLVQVKRNCKGFQDRAVEKGTVAEITIVDASDNSVRIKAGIIQDGWCWLDVENVRKYEEPDCGELPEPTVPEEPQLKVEVGDKVLIGAEGAGCGVVFKQYAGLVCTVTAQHPRYTDAVYIQHPDVKNGAAYATYTKYIEEVNPPEPEVVIECGDVVIVTEATTSTHSEVYQAGGVYRVSGNSVRDGYIRLWDDGAFSGYASLPKSTLLVICKAGDYEDATA